MCFFTKSIDYATVLRFVRQLLLAGYRLGRKWFIVAKGLCFALHPFGYFLLYLFHCNLPTWTLAIPSLHWSAPSAAWTLWPGLRSYREIIECRYIGLFSISKSISYRTSHIEYLDMPLFCLFPPKILRKFRKFS